MEYHLLKCLSYGLLRFENSLLSFRHLFSRGVTTIFLVRFLSRSAEIRSLGLKNTHKLLLEFGYCRLDSLSDGRQDFLSLLQACALIEVLVRRLLPIAR